MTRTLSRLQGGTLEWTGEHWMSMLRLQGSSQDSAIVSHFSMKISPRGEGNVAVVRIGGEEGFHAVCTDNAGILEFVIPRCFERVSYWQAGLPVIESAFTRWGDATREPGWRIETEDGHTIVTGWTVTDPPVVLNSPWRNNQEVFSILYFTQEATVELDSNPIEGRPYLRDIWQDTLGGERSSCVFALSESFFDMILPPKPSPAPK